MALVSKPAIAIVIVSWNVCELLHRCLESILNDLADTGLKARVWVVDNASQDGSVAMLQTHFPQVRLIASPQNLGFAGGNNLALRQIAAEGAPRYVWLLNPDTKVRPGATRRLIDFMEQRSRVAVAGARLFYEDGSFQHGAFGFPGLWQILFDLFPLPGRLYESRLNGRYPRASYECGVPFVIDHPLGASMMVRWAAIDQVGYLDEAFYMYCEEIDWCMRIKRAGWEIYCVPGAHVVHHAGQSTGQIRSASFVNLWRSRGRLYDKHYSGFKRWLARLLVRLGMGYKIWTIRQQETRGEIAPQKATADIQALAAAMSAFTVGE